MGILTTRQQRRALAADNRRSPEALREIPRCDWPLTVSGSQRGPARVWRSRDFLVMLFSYEASERLSVCRTSLTGDRWEDGISWEDLQRLKNEAGFGTHCAVELFPPDREVVNVANMRHLWLTDAPPFMWRAPAPSQEDAG